MDLKIISAGAGSGKTYRLTSEMVALLKQGVRANGIIATTFTNKAAAELQQRVRLRLLEEGMTRQADDLTNALIGTVHSLGVKLLRRFTYEAGVSPEVDIIADEDQQILFNQSLATVLTEDRVQCMERLSGRLGLNKSDRYKTDWRSELKRLTDVARANDFGADVLKKSKVLSFESFRQFLGEVSEKPEEKWKTELTVLFENAIDCLENNEDETKITRDGINAIKSFRTELKLRGELYWHQWAKIGKMKIGAKSREDFAGLKAFVETHDAHPSFHSDIREFIYELFDIAIEALGEYGQYKKQRGLIDYTDMEVLIKRLLENEQVKAVLEEELDLLMVDEFQDTSPIQLEIFLKLSQLAKYSIWVGDPKQSIYGFRGADPRLMLAIIRQSGGVKPQDILGHSWRSREDIVLATNALFSKAFPQLPVDQLALQPKRRVEATTDSINPENEPIEVGDALIHWHFEYEGEGRRQPGRPWTENCIAASLHQALQSGLTIKPKGEKAYRRANPGDVAILCRSNVECRIMAEALHRAGLKAAISRAGLLNTAEAKLILACLKYLLNQYDSLSVAEILLLAADKDIETIIEERIAFLEEADQKPYKGQWAEQEAFIQKLNELRLRVVELSSAEILNLLLDELDLRRIIVSWGNIQQRLANTDVIRKLALQYEEACNRLHTAASLGGFLLWLNELESNEKDMQGSGIGADSINVLTYHKSKGLEWPVVICHSLEANLRADVWGISIVAEKEDVDLNNVLGHRRLRYWVNPYSDQYRNTPLEERINESQDKKAKTRQALEEEARLLYVGITRARDYLVFPSTGKPSKWLNRVWHQGKEEFPTLDHHTFESPWEWEGKFLNIQTETFPYPKDFTHSEVKEAAITFIEEAAGKKAHSPYRIDLKKENLEHEINAGIRQALSYTSAFAPKEDEDIYNLAKALKAMLTADHPDYEPSERQEMAMALLHRYEINEIVDSGELLRISGTWFHFLNDNFSINKIHRKYPIRYFHKKRLFETIIDLILETGEGLVIIQNSGFNGSDGNWNAKAKGLGSQLHLSKLAVREIFQPAEVRTFVHFVMGAILIEVETKKLRIYRGANPP